MSEEQPNASDNNEPGETSPLGVSSAKASLATSASAWLDDAMAWKDENDIRELDTLRTHAQLMQFFEDDEARELRIARVLAGFEDSLSRPSKPWNTNRRRLFSILASTAAVTLFGLFLPRRSALASVKRAIETSAQPVPRAYSVELESKGLRGRVNRSVRLVSRGKFEFLATVQDVRVQPAQFGGNAQYRWGIVGSRKWRSDLETEFPFDFIFDRASLRFFTLHEVLRGIPEHYEVSYANQPNRNSTPIRNLPTQDTVRATLRKFNQRISLPDEVVTSIDRESGIVFHLRATWATRNMGIQRIEVHYTGTAAVQNDTFDLEASMHL